MPERNSSIGRERHTGPAARRRTHVALHRRDTILEAVSFAAERFLETLGWKRHIQAVLERLGAAAGVSRVYLFENHVGASGELVTSQRYEWSAPGVAPQLSNPELQEFSYRATGFERWAAALEAGELIHGPIRTFPPTERALLDLPPGSPVEYSIRQIEETARRAAELTRQMLVYAGKEQFVVQAVNLSAIVEEMSRLVQVSFGKGVSLQRHLDHQLPISSVLHHQMIRRSPVVSRWSPAQCW